MKLSLLASTIALALVAAGCGRGDGPAGRNTTTATATTTSTTTGAEPVPEVVLLVAGPDGVGLRSDGWSTRIVDAVGVRAAVPDLGGGLFFVGASRDSPPPQIIEAIEAPGRERVVAVAEPEARWVSLEDVAAIDGRPTLVYRVGRTLPNDCEPDTECLWQYQVDHLMLRDLESGEETNLGTIGSFESSSISFRFGGSRAIVTLTPYGAPYSCVGVLPASALLADPVPDNWIGEGGRWRDHVEWLGPGGCDGTHEGCPHQAACTLPEAAAISDDGARAAIAWSRQPAEPDTPPQPLTVTVFDLDTPAADPLWQVTIGEPDEAPTWIDFDGHTAVLGRQRGGEAIGPLLVRADGIVVPLDIDGTARFWVAAPS